MDLSNTKDKVFFYDKKQLSGQISKELKLIEAQAEDDPSQPGLILPNGRINWSCPCIGNAAIGPCSKYFRDAFTCFHYSEAPVRGSECLNEFEKLQECMKKYPNLHK